MIKKNNIVKESHDYAGCRDRLDAMPMTGKTFTATNYNHKLGNVELICKESLEEEGEEEE